MLERGGLVLTQKKDPKDRYVKRSFTLPPEMARGIANWPYGKLTAVIRAAISQELSKS
jgi:hypothetical protein